MLLGLLANEATARCLKHLVQQERPAATCGPLEICSSYGFPSSHTQCMFFAFALNMCINASKHAQDSRGKQLGSAFRMSAFDRAWATVELLALACGAVAVGYSRVYLGYHSMEQVLAGAIFGMLFGLAWGLMTARMAPVFGSLASLLRLWHFKDTWGIAEPLRMERLLIKSDSQVPAAHKTKPQ